MKKLLQILGEVAIVLIVLIAILLGAARLLLPYCIDSYRPQFARLISKSIAHPVSFGNMQTSWSGLHPVFSFDHIIVYDDAHKAQLLTVKQLKMGIHLFASLIKQKVIPAQFYLSGASLSVQQLADNDFNINGIHIHVADQTQNHNNIQSILNALVGLGQITLDDINIDWHGKNGNEIPIIHLKLQSSGALFRHSIVGTATLAQKNLAQVRLVVKMHRNIPYINQINAKAYIDIKNLEIEPWLKNYSLPGIAVNAGNVETLQLWINLRNREIKEIQSIFKLSNGLITAQALQDSILVNTLSGNLTWLRNDKGWNLAADHIHLDVNHRHWPLTQFSLQNQLSVNNHTTVQFYRINAVELTQISQILAPSSFITPNMKDILLAVHPEGSVKNLMIRRELLPNQSSNLSASADFKQFGLQPWNKIPGIENLNGHILFTPVAGEVQLRGEGLLVIDADHLFRQPLTWADYHGRIQWLRSNNGWAFQADHLALNNDVLSFRGDMNLFLPQIGSPFIRLLGGVSVNKIAQLHQYIPAKILSNKLTEWFDQAFVGGKQATAKLLLQGPLSHFPFSDNTGRFEIAARAANLDFRFHQGWPIVNGVNAEALLNSKRLDINVTNARILGVPIHGVRASIADLTSAPLEIYSSIKTDASNALRFIVESPLKTPLAGLQQLAMQGPLRLNLSLEIPLHEAQDAHELPKVNGNITFEPGITAQLPAWNIHLDQLQGDIHFTELSVESQGLQANWLGQPVAISIQSAEGPNSSTTSIQFSGKAMMDSLIKNYQLDAIRTMVKGTINYNAVLQLNKNKGQTQTKLVISSDLKGVDINLPDPVGKIASSQMPLQVQLNLDQPQQLNIFATLAKKLSVALSIAADKSGKHFLNSANLRFGPKPAVLPETKGLIIDGVLAQLNGSEISELLTPYLAVSKTNNASNPVTINYINLFITQLDALGMSVPRVSIQAYPTNTAWSLQINSPSILGKIFLSKNLASQGIEGSFQHFTFVPSTTQSTQSIEPAKVPPLNLVVHNFNYAKRHLGDVSLITFPQKNALVIKKLALKNPNLNLTAHGVWQSLGNRQQTLLSGDIQSSDLGAGLKAWDVTHGLESGEGKMIFALSWPAAAYQYDAAIINGQFSLNFRNGRIVNISQGSEAEMGIGRILNLLSLQSLPRRLSFDFSDLFSKGFTFDTMKGDFTVVKGNATTSNAYLSGPIGKVEAQGTIGLGAKDYNLNLTITPYVTSSIPVVATIVSGPLVGAAAWVANKIFGGVVNQFTSHTYRVTGSWANPVIEKLSALERRNQTELGIAQRYTLITPTLDEIWLN